MYVKTTKSKLHCQKINNMLIHCKTEWTSSKVMDLAWTHADTK